jgi:fumarate hydratase, class II
MRTESDSMGTIEVPDEVYWGAQTARSLIHFNIAEDRMPPELIRAIGILKKAAALVNNDLGKLPKLSLREANQALKFLSDEEFQKVVRPETMTKPDEL